MVSILGGDNDTAPIMEDFTACLHVIVQKTQVDPVRSYDTHANRFAISRALSSLVSNHVRRETRPR